MLVSSGAERNRSPAIVTTYRMLLTLSFLHIESVHWLIGDGRHDKQGGYQYFVLAADFLCKIWNTHPVNGYMQSNRIEDSVMKRLYFILVLVAISMSMPAHSREMMFGDVDKIHKIQDVNFKGPKGESLYLGHRTTTKYFILGIYLTDQGYVLADRDSQTYYYSLDNKVIASLQAEGALPNPLPKYEVNVFEYLGGYSLWFGIFLATLSLGYKKVRANIRKKALLASLSKADIK